MGSGFLPFKQHRGASSYVPVYLTSLHLAYNDLKHLSVSSCRPSLFLCYAE